MSIDRQTIARTSGPRFILNAEVTTKRSYFFPLVIGIVGAAILCALGVWQMQRLEWKETILADIETRLSAELVPLPQNPIYENDNYRGVEVGGSLTGNALHVLTSLQPSGPGFRVIRKMETLDNRVIMLDLGYIPEVEKDAPNTDGAVFVEGNLIWPDETDSFTPLPNTDRNIWFARNVETMAEALGTEPIMVVARNLVPDFQTTPMPVTVNIANDHLEYAITWFSLMAVWIMMTLFLLWRIKRENA